MTPPTYIILLQRCPTHSPFATCGECFFLNTPKIGPLWSRLDFSYLIHTFLLKTTQWPEKRWPRMLVVNDIGEFIKTFYTFRHVLKMWRMFIFIRHKCGKRHNIVGHRWFRETLL